VYLCRVRTTLLRLSTRVGHSAHLPKICSFSPCPTLHSASRPRSGDWALDRCAKFPPGGLALRGWNTFSLLHIVWLLHMRYFSQATRRLSVGRRTLAPGGRRTLTRRRPEHGGVRCARWVASHVNIFHNFINYIPGPVHNSYSLPVHFRTQGAEIEMMTSCSIRARLRGGLE
jgi:hypothetical protein